MKTQNTKSGVSFLRNLVFWLNQRNEYLNENKTPLALIAEYRKYLASNK